MATIGELVVSLRAETAAFRREMQAVRKDTSDIKVGLSEMGATVATTVAGFLTFRVAAAAVGAITDATIAAEQSQAKLQAVLRATGNAAGVTAEQINQLATQLQNTTLFDDDAVRDSAAVLATFRNVSGAAFTETLRLAADLSAVFGGSLQSSVTMLGKALEDPITGLTSLRRVGVSFNEQQRAQIKDLMEQNRLLDAQTVILRGVSAQVSGTAEAMHTGLAGSLHEVSAATEDFLEGLGKTPAVAKTAEGALGALARAIRSLTPSMDNREAIIGEMMVIQQVMALRAGDARSREEQTKRYMALMQELQAAEALAFGQARRAREQGAGAVEPTTPGGIDVPAIKAQAAQVRSVMMENAGLMLRLEREVQDSLAEGLAASVRRDATAAAAQRDMINDATATAVAAAEEFEQAQASTAQKAESAWGTLAYRMQFLLEDSLTGQIRSLREFAGQFLAILARMAAEAAALDIMKGITGLGRTLVGGAAGGLGPVPGGDIPTVSIPTPSFAMAAAGGPTVNMHMTLAPNVIDGRDAVKFLEQYAPALAGNVVQQLRRSGALESALKGR